VATSGGLHPVKEKVHAVVHARKVDADYVAPQIGPDFVEAHSVSTDPGVVHQKLHGTERRLHPLGHGGPTAAIGDVQWSGHDATPRI
jgi:hypothetical protein